MNERNAQSEAELTDNNADKTSAENTVDSTVEKQVHKATHGPNTMEDVTVEHASKGFNDVTVEHSSAQGRTQDDSVPLTVVSKPGPAVDDVTLEGESAGTGTDGSRRLSYQVEIGKQVGPYRIVSLLGRGGMGVVYLARHEQLQREVAIKMILSGSLRHTSLRERFNIEARTIANLRHPNVVQLFEFGEFSDSPYFALEYIDGGTLADRIQEAPLNAKDAARIVQKLALAMQVAHDQSIIHRDLKPANILLSSEGEPKISDFGLAKDLVSQDDQETKAGTVMGTPSFMSPEQARGEIESLDGATDQYALGAILYACISGRPPFMSATTIDTLSQVVHKEPIPPNQLASHVPKDLETICLKALQKDATKRYSNCGEMADDLKRFLGGMPITARPVGLAERTVRWCKRNPKVAIPSALAALFIISTLGISLWAWAATSAQAAVIAQERDNVKQERDEAEKQRDEARRQRIIADQQKAVAEDNEQIAKKQAELALKNIQFVLTDVDTKLREQPGMNKLRIGVLESVSQRWGELETELVGGIRGEAVPTLMAVRQMMATAFVELDELPMAEAEFSQLETMARERIAIKGRNDATRSNLARVLFTAAPLARRIHGTPEKGIVQYREALELIAEIRRDPQPQQSSPSELNLLQLQAAIAQNLGVELLREGLVRETEESFTQSLEANESAMSLIKGAPGFSELNEDQRDTQTAALQIQIDKARLGLAYIQLRLGKTEEAMPAYEKAIASRREIFDRRQNMLIMKSELAGFLKMYGKSNMWLGRLDDAVPPLKESMQLSEEAWQSDPDKANLKRAFAECLYLFGMLKQELGQTDESLSLLERSRLLWAELVEGSPDEKNRINLMLSDAALGNIDAAKKLIDEMRTGTENNAELHLERARALSQLASSASGEQRSTLVSEALDALQRSVAEGYSDPYRIRVEPELENLHQQARYTEILAGMK